MSTARVYDAIWARKMGLAAPARPVDRWAVVAAEFTPADRLLDVGCGDGRATLAVRRLARTIVGTDIAVAACAAARARGVLAVPSSLDTGRLAFADRSFDAVTCLDVIEHVTDPVRVMEEMARVLRPGGRAYVTTVNMRYVKFLWRLAVRGVFPRTSDDPDAYDGGHIHYFTAENIRALGRMAGLRPIRHVGIVPSGRLRRLQPFRRLWPVREFLAAGFLIVFGRETP
jgi:2-polyprenyl-6-hydroxyphenyl methylase/3-demethylubiquinone-9 3-methyltransferase